MNANLQTTEETMSKKDFQSVKMRDVDNGGGLRLALNSFAELEKFSHFMALSNFVPKHLRGKQADCLAVLLQSMRWNMDPFAVAQKTYFVNDGMAYEAQLVNAIILARAPLKNRPKITWEGEGDTLTCTVSATFEGDDEPQVFTAENKTISTRNSPLWKQQPKQQLAYFATRAWARIYCPDVLMGIYTKEEFEDTSMHIGADNAIDITAASAMVMDMQSAIAADKEASPEEKKKRTKRAKEAGADPETGELPPETAPKPAGNEPEIGNVPPALFDQITTKFAASCSGAKTISDLAILKHENRDFLAAVMQKNPPKYNFCVDAYNVQMTAIGADASKLMDLV